jgi:predicted MFS family arabinose efflux permease
MSGVYAIISAGEHGWGATRTIVVALASVALLVVFVLRQARIETPLMPLRLFKIRNVVGANLVQALLVVGMFGMFFMAALYLQRVLGYDALQVGLAFLPTTVVMGFMSLRVSEYVNTNYGLRASLLPSLVLLIAGLLLFTQTPVDATYATDILPAMLLLGAGAGLGFPAIMQLAMSGVEPSDTGLASGLVNTSVQVGGAIGLAVLATLADGRTDEQVAAGVGQAEALNAGYHLAYLLGAGAAGLALVVALFVLRIPSVAEQRAAMEEMQAAMAA